MTEATYNFTTWNGSAMTIRLAHPDIASSEYSSNAPLHNVTILLPIVISVLVLVAVLTTLFAFMRKQDIFHEPSECRSNSAQNLRLRTSLMRSKEDINEMLSFPMTDYHSLCANTNSKSKLCEVGLTTSNQSTNQQLNIDETIYGKPFKMASSPLSYTSPLKRSVLSEENGVPNDVHQHMLSTRVTVNSQHIYAEPNAHHTSIQSSSSQSYGQPRLALLANVPVENCLIDKSESNVLPLNDTYRALITSNAHI